MQAELKIFDAVNRLEKHNGKRYNEAQIAKATGLHRHTVAALMKGKPDRIVAILLHFFATEGMPVTVNDLFTVERPSDTSALSHFGGKEG